LGLGGNWHVIACRLEAYICTVYSVIMYSLKHIYVHMYSLKYSDSVFLEAYICDSKGTVHICTELCSTLSDMILKISTAHYSTMFDSAIVFCFTGLVSVNLVSTVQCSTLF